MNNSMQQMQGFGVDPEQNKFQQQMQLAAALASMPDTDVAYNWMEGDMPQGEMVSGHYVAPSWAQYAANALKQGIGGMMVKRRGDKAEEVANLYGDMQKPKSPYAGMSSMPTDPGEIDSIFGQ